MRSASVASNRKEVALILGGRLGSHLYILRCVDGSYCTGLTKRDIKDRVDEHNTGAIEGCTSGRRPVELVFIETCERIVDAIDRERQIG